MQTVVQDIDKLRLEVGQIGGAENELLKHLVGEGTEVGSKVTSENTEKVVLQYQGGKNGIMDIDEEAVLFTDVAIPIEWGVKEIKKAGRFQIQVTAEAIQANGFASARDAFQVLGESVEKGALDEQG